MDLQKKYDQISEELFLTQEVAVMLTQLCHVFGVSQVAKLYGLSKAELRVIVSFVKSGLCVYGKINPSDDTWWCRYTYPDLPLVETEEYVAYSERGVQRMRTRRVRTNRTHRNSSKYFFESKVRPEPEDLIFLRDTVARRKKDPEGHTERGDKVRAMVYLMLKGAPKEQVQSLIDGFKD